MSNKPGISELVFRIGGLVILLAGSSQADPIYGQTPGFYISNSSGQNFTEIDAPSGPDAVKTRLPDSSPELRS